MVPSYIDISSRRVNGKDTSIRKVFDYPNALDDLIGSVYPVVGSIHQVGLDFIGFC